MTNFTGPPFVITSSSDTTLYASDAFNAPDTGIVVSSNNFGGYTLTLSDTFASDLYTLMGSPSLYTGYKIYFSIGNGNFFVIQNADSNIITDYSSTFLYDSGQINSDFHPILFQLTQITPDPQFTLWG